MVICEENIFQLNLSRRFKKQSDLSLLDHKFDDLLSVHNFLTYLSVNCQYFVYFQELNSTMASFTGQKNPPWARAATCKHFI